MDSNELLKHKLCCGGTSYVVKIKITSKAYVLNESTSVATAFTASAMSVNFIKNKSKVIHPLPENLLGANTKISLSFD